MRCPSVLSIFNLLISTSIVLGDDLCSSNRCICRGTQSMKCLASDVHSVPVFVDNGKVYETVSLARNNLTSIGARAFVNLQVSLSM